MYLYNYSTITEMWTYKETCLMLRCSVFSSENRVTTAEQRQ